MVKSCAFTSLVGLLGPSRRAACPCLATPAASHSLLLVALFLVARCTRVGRGGLGAAAAVAGLPVERLADLHRALLELLHLLLERVRRDALLLHRALHRR